MNIPQIVIDTNVVIAALRSKRGASYKLLLLLGSGRIEAHISIPLALEYEDAAKRLLGSIALSADEIEGSSRIFVETEPTQLQSLLLPGAILVSH